MTVTLADVAARAQVSPATVSRVLNGNYPVAATTRERVLRAVDELDYVLNGPASSLAAATSDLVGILVNDIADPFFGIMASAIQSEIGGPGGRAGGERLAVTCNTGGSPERELTYLTLLQRQRAAAVVLTGGAVEDAPHAAAVAAKLRRLEDAGTRVVLCGRPGADGASARARASAARVHRGAGGADDHAGPAGGASGRARGRGDLRGSAVDRARAVRPAVGVRGDAGVVAAGSVSYGGGGGERLRRAGGVCRAAGLRAADSG
jgi:transcriptional regulator with XRE-family HTH domain